MNAHSKSMLGTFSSASPEETRDLARRLAATLAPGAVIALCGDLGAGKTCFVQGLAEGLGVRSAVNSPTYTLVHEYRGVVPLYHIDLYRLNDADEALDMGLDEYIYGAGITAIEWAERLGTLLPEGSLRISLRAGEGEEDRVILIEGEGTP